MFLGKRVLSRVSLGVSMGVATALVLASCSDEEKESGEGVATGATCPSGFTLTYENFAQPFMATYCTRCHSSILSGNARNGAPLGHDFDTENGILVVAGHVDEFAAAGPNGVNTARPPDGAKPSEAERRQLGEWLACEMQSSDAGGGHDE